jgi:hypothetical protein
LRFLKRFAFGRTAPKRDWVNLVGDDIAFERDTGEVRVWRFSDGDALGVYFFNVEPDLPRLAEFSSFVAATREAVIASGAALVECKLVALEHVPAIRQIIKAPQKPSGMTYLGAFTLPFATFSYVLKVQCEEQGMTGLREAVLLHEALQSKTVTITSDSSTFIKGDAGRFREIRRPISHAPAISTAPSPTVHRDICEARQGYPRSSSISSSGGRRIAAQQNVAAAKPRTMLFWPLNVGSRLAAER